ncbi:MAG TPA: metalloregulator ArsR/SmtB family transcription factor [Verrucomicrobiae bacterium]|nr:metalloregulator ArsR/SmtB family transcription factor [Verrucomicrobiae bacterium]
MKRRAGGRRAGADLIGTIPPRFFRALCDPNRLALLGRLAECGRPCGVTELSGCCAVDFSVVSRHLATLRDAGILAASRRGKEIYYEVRAAELIGTLRAIADAIEGCCGRGAGAPAPRTTKPAGGTRGPAGRKGKP